jgi:hypothetical protein
VNSFAELMKAKEPTGKCTTKWCRNPKAKNDRGYPLPYCWKCKSRRLKEHYPATYTRNLMKQVAKRRGISFSITLAQWKEFCARTGYLEKRGRKPDSLSIDRIDHRKGYHIDNIRAIPSFLNSWQGHTEPGRVLKQNHPRIRNPDVEPF